MRSPAGFTVLHLLLSCFLSWAHSAVLQNYCRIILFFFFLFCVYLEMINTAFWKKILLLFYYMQFFPSFAQFYYIFKCLLTFVTVPFVLLYLLQWLEPNVNTPHHLSFVKLAFHRNNVFFSFLFFWGFVQWFVDDNRSEWAQAGLKKPWIWAVVKKTRWYLWFKLLSCSSHWNFCLFPWYSAAAGLFYVSWKLQVINYIKTKSVGTH